MNEIYLMLLEMEVLQIAQLSVFGESKDIYCVEMYQRTLSSIVITEKHTKFCLDPIAILVFLALPSAYIINHVKYIFILICCLYLKAPTC